MRKRAERTLKELYDLTKRIKEPKITPVLKGICRIQGPVDDWEIHFQGAHYSDEKKTLLPKDHTTMSETGTCTVCSAPCSLCMHYKSESGFSYNRSVRTEADSSSVINADEIPIFKSRLRGKLQHAASETSNLLSTSSSHDSYSENAKGKTNLRASEANDASDVVDMPQVLFSDEVKESQPFKRDHAPDQFNLNSDIPELCHSFYSGKGDGQSELECHGDNILCISGTTDSNVVVCDSIVDIVEKGSSFVVNNDIITDEAGDDNQDHVTGESHFIPKTSNATVDSSLLLNSCNLASVNNVSHVKSQLPSCINDVSPVTFPLSSHPEDAKSSLLKGGSMVIGNLKLQPQSVINISVETEKVESSFVSLTVGKSPENDSSTCPKDQVSAENSIKSVFSSGTLQIDGLCRDTISGTVKPSDNCSEDHHVNDILERDDAILAAAKDEYQNVQSQAVTVGENYESDLALDDVKVCDICGDAGREDLLAICSRCSDGAEHTYCMQEMLDKVPEGEWLCEECKIKGMENQNVDESEAVSGRLKSACLIDTKQNSMSISIPKLAHKLDTRLTDLDAGGSVKGLQIPHFSSKRQVDHLEEGKASELSGSSIERASPRKKPVSRQLSAKNTVAGKVKSAIMETSSEAQPAKGSDAFSRAKNYLNSSSFKGLPPLYSPRGKFSRSVSFNNSNVNQNLKTLIENGPPKQKSTRDNDLRKDSLFKPSPNTTSKHTTSGLSNTESGIKNSALLQSRIEGLRTLTEVKERNTVEKKNFSAIGSSSIRSSAATASNYPLKVDSKFVQLLSDGKMSSSSETGIRNSIEGVDVDELGSNEGKKQVSYSSKSAESSNGNYNTDSPKRLKIDKECIQRTVSAVDGSLKKFEIASLHGIAQPLESANKGTVLRDSATAALRPSALGGTRAFRSHRGNEKGRVSHHRSIDKLGVSAHRTSTEQKLSEVDKRGNKWREVVDAAMSKSELKCNKLDTPVKLPSDSADMIFEADSKHITSVSSQKSFFVERNNDKICSKDSSLASANILAAIGSVRSHVLSVGSSHKANSIRDTRATTELSAKSLTETTGGKPPLLENTSSGTAVAKPPLLECPSSVTTVQKHPIFAKPLSGMAVPKLDCIWQGSFNVTGDGSPCKTFFGIQAHLSKCASHRVFQVATKAPANIQLEEVSHISSCPLQLLRAGAQEENIALFFFAKDIESYEISYRKLTDKMHKNDLALRGNVDGAELLIFTSNKLPVNAQRWNKMHYLWGMFRGKSRIFLPVMGEQKSSFSNEDFSAPPISDVSNAHNLEISLKQKKLSDSTASQGMQRESINGVDLRTVSAVIEDTTSRTPVASSTQNLLNQVLAGTKIPQEHPSFPIGSSSLGKSEPLRAITDTPNLRLQISTTKSCSEEKNVVRSDGTRQMKSRSARRKKAKKIFYHTHGLMEKEQTVSDFIDTKDGDSDGLTNEIGIESSLRKATSLPSISPNCTKGADSINIEEENENGEKETSQAVVGMLGDDQIGNALGADLGSFESTDNRKRLRSCSPKTMLQRSREMPKSAIETAAPTSEKPSWLPADDDREQKKILDPGAMSIINENVSAQSSSKVHPLHSSIFKHHQAEESICSETPMPQTTRATEMYFFPIDLAPVQNANSNKIIEIPSSDDDDTLETSSPDLELALGGTSKPMKPFVLSSLFSSVGGKQQSQPGPSGDSDDAPASLSLSL
ncbi:hypothetical protein KSP39_PZI022703 [Platanthera zijinensis]|uniref:PHD-type domain-containing protein n=1 Tax=Platanthera zijinensis TaxID=2320716 RepID=A0AAP0AV97_9ASPA